MNNLLYIGYITGPFGLKGELKINSDSNHLDKIFKVGNTLYICNNPYEIEKVRFHKNSYIVLFKGITSIDNINDLLKKEVYVNKEDLDLKDNEYLICELLNLKVIFNQKKLGNVKEILYNKTNYFIKCDKLIIPVNERYIKSINLSNKEIIVYNIEELVL